MELVLTVMMTYLGYVCIMLFNIINHLSRTYSVRCTYIHVCYTVTLSHLLRNKSAWNILTYISNDMQAAICYGFAQGQAVLINMSDSCKEKKLWIIFACMKFEVFMVMIHTVTLAITSYRVDAAAVPVLVTSFSPSWPSYITSIVHLGFMVNKVTFRQVLVWAFCFSCCHSTNFV